MQEEKAKMQIAEHAGHNVVFCADRNYLPYLGVAAYSLLANNARPGLAIYIVTDEIDPPNRQRFERLSAEFGVPFTVYPVTAQDRNDIPSDDGC